MIQDSNIFFASCDLGFKRWSHYVALTDIKP